METSYQWLEVLSFCDREGLISFNKNNPASFHGEKKSTMQISGVYIFVTIPKNLQVKSRPGYVSRIICLL